MTIASISEAWSTHCYQQSVGIVPHRHSSPGQLHGHCRGSGRNLRCGAGRALRFGAWRFPHREYLHAGLYRSANDAMIGGFIVGSGDPTKVIVRALGPSLAAFGVIQSTTESGSGILRLGWHTDRFERRLALDSGTGNPSYHPADERSRVGHCRYFGAGGLHSRGARCHPFNWDGLFEVYNLEP